MMRGAIIALLALCWIISMPASTVFATLLEAPNAGPSSTITVPTQFHFVDIGWAWTDAEKAVIREALKEWDDRICNVTTFLEDPTGGFSFDWANDTVFKNWGTEMDYTDALALCVPSGNTSLSGITKNEIYFNVKYSWYVDPTPGTDETFTGYDLLSVAKHEIGHILGIAGDYQAPARRSEVMWYAFAEGERRHPTDQDFNELQKLGYHVPEPSSLMLLLLGLGGGMMLWRRSQRMERGMEQV
jgi:hypothetical protein